MEGQQKIGVGVGVMVFKDGKLLLGRRHGDPSKATSLLKGEGTWTMPGGKVDFGETFEAAAKRETLEETGLVIDKMDLIAINQDMVDTAHFVTIGFLCKEFSGEPQVMEPDKITEWHRFDLDNLPDPLYFLSAKLLENYKQKSFYIPL